MYEELTFKKKKETYQNFRLCFRKKRKKKKEEKKKEKEPEKPTKPLTTEKVKSLLLFNPPRLHPYLHGYIWTVW